MELITVFGWSVLGRKIINVVRPTLSEMLSNCTTCLKIDELNFFIVRASKQKKTYKNFSLQIDDFVKIAARKEKDFSCRGRAAGEFGST